MTTMIGEALELTRPQAVQLARKMWADGNDGWSVTEIRDYLATRGHDVTRITVKTWVDPEWGRQRNEGLRASKRRCDRNRRGTQTFRILDNDAQARLHELVGAGGPLGAPEFSPEFLLALRIEDGHTYEAIAKIARRFFGVEWTADQLRFELYKLGAPKNPAKVQSALKGHRDRS